MSSKFLFCRLLVIAVPKQKIHRICLLCIENTGKIPGKRVMLVLIGVVKYLSQRWPNYSLAEMADSNQTSTNVNVFWCSHFWFLWAYRPFLLLMPWDDGPQQIDRRNQSPDCQGKVKPYNKIIEIKSVYTLGRTD